MRWSGWPGCSAPAGPNWSGCSTAPIAATPAPPRSPGGTSSSAARGWRWTTKIAFASENRRAEGLIGDLSVRANIVLAMQAERGWTRQIPRRQQDELADRYIKALDIRPTSPETLVRNLSGGNQQKVLLARWLLTEPSLLILDEPTRGIDVGAKAQIQKLVAGLSEKGMAVIFISAELEEVLRLSHRIGILRDRRKVAEIVNSEATTVEDIMGIIAAEAQPGMKKHHRVSRLLWPAVVLIALLLANLLWNHSFFDITVRDGNLYGAPVDILRRAAPIVLVALGMTLVIATRGIDLSVGAVAAITGSWASMYIISSADGASVDGGADRGRRRAADGVARRRLERFPGLGSRYPAHRGHAGADGRRARPGAGDHQREDPLPGQLPGLQAHRRRLPAGGAVLDPAGRRHLRAHRGADPEDRARHADRVGRASTRRPAGWPASGPGRSSSWSTSSAGSAPASPG